MTLREYLDKNSLTIRDFAKIAGYSPLHICNYLNKKIKVTKRTAWIWSLATANECTIEELLEANPETSTIYEKRKQRDALKKFKRLVN
jgi:plasmid maintenance system antidote protein VapI